MRQAHPDCPRSILNPLRNDAPPVTCGSSEVIAKGFFLRGKDQRRVQRYLCRSCKAGFSARTLDPDYRQRKTNINEPLHALLVSGMSQRRSAFLLRTTPATVARRLPFFATQAQVEQAAYLERLGPCEIVLFDEMISFEHSKMKPLSLPIVVDERTQSILAIGVARIPAFGPNADKSRKKYGMRKDERPAALREVLGSIRRTIGASGFVLTDEATAYPKALAEVFPKREHAAFKGRRGCVVGQGELKVGGWDPLFMLNHGCAMVRENVARLKRRTWCTTKKPERLRDLLTMYTWFHNGYLLPKRQAEKETRIRNKMKRVI